MQVLISPAWLKSIGFSRYIGQPLKVTQIQETPVGRFYHVTMPNGSPWVIWDVRGVTEIGQGD